MLPVKHWIPIDAPKLGRYQARAICGKKVDLTSHDFAPTCQACLEKLAEEAVWAQQIEDDARKEQS